MLNRRVWRASLPPVCGTSRATDQRRHETGQQPKLAELDRLLESAALEPEKVLRQDH